VTVIAPAADLPGALLDARIATVQAIVNAAVNKKTLDAQIQLLNQLQVAAVDHYMVTGWLNAATILASYQPLTQDKAGQTLKARVAFLQGLVNNPPIMPAGNHDGFGDSGIVTILQNFQQQLYAAQTSLVEQIMNFPGGTSAATMLANLTGSQSFTFQYVFSGVGFSDAWI
jgi:hypothetical protein